MTGIALTGINYVGSRLDLGIDAEQASGVTGFAATGCQRPARSGVVHPGRRERSVVGMAGITGCGRRQVTCGLAWRSAAIMASRTAPSHSRRDDCVVKDSPRPGYEGCMTGIALCRGRHMGCRFGQRIDRGVAATVTA